jgi:hypothetical protein
MNEQQTYKPGDEVPYSGIYEVIHQGPHRTNHRVTVIAFDKFPNCRLCREEVQYRLVESAVDINADGQMEN